MNEDLIKALYEFARWVLVEGSWQGSSLDGGDIQDKALRLGLLNEEPYDPKKHGPSEFDAEPGDPWFTLKPLTR